MYTSQSAVGE